MPTDTAKLLDAWSELMPSQRELGEDLIRRYSEPHRRYHTVDHLAYVLDRIDEFAVSSSDLFMVRLAAWFHDAVYAIPTRELTNEEASARLTVASLIDAGMDQEDINEVTRLVRLTATHVPPPGDRNGSLLCDADLAILGAPPEVYQAYAEAVRAEYAHVPDRDFAVGRLEILQRLLERSIYRTTKGRRLTAQAHANLTAESTALAADLGVDLEHFFR
ncbi:MAG TPA: metal-dependent phosphohydrolase [Propionibacteriaceae bacterium]|nr:metal-dependent phosphohydrolase [Propionibacteriaceae bacterium]